MRKKSRPSYVWVTTLLWHYLYGSALNLYFFALVHPKLNGKGIWCWTCCQESDINFVKLQGDSTKRQDFFILSMYSRMRKRLDTPSHAGSWGKEPSTWEERDTCSSTAQRVSGSMNLAHEPPFERGIRRRGNRNFEKRQPRFPVSTWLCGYQQRAILGFRRNPAPHHAALNSQPQMVLKRLAGHFSMRWNRRWSTGWLPTTWNTLWRGLVYGRHNSLHERRFRPYCPQHALIKRVLCIACM